MVRLDAEGGEWSASLHGRALPRRKGPPYLLYRKLGGSQSQSGAEVRGKKPSVFAGDRTPVVQPVAKHYSDPAYSQTWRYYSNVLSHTLRSHDVKIYRYVSKYAKNNSIISIILHER